MILSLARLTLRQARQSRLLLLAVLLLLAAYILAGVAGGVALTGQRATQAVLQGALLRLGAVGLMALFAVAAPLREQDDRTLDLLLALEWPRSHYIAGKLLAYAGVALALAAACGLSLTGLAPISAIAAWTLSLACELWLVAALGLLFALTFRQTVTALAAVAAFYVLARGLNALLLLVRDPVFVHEGAFRAFVEWGVSALAWVMPSLHAFTRAGWLDATPLDPLGLGLVLGQTAVYGALIAAAAAFDLYRREL